MNTPQIKAADSLIKEELDLDIQEKLKRKEE